MSKTMAETSLIFDFYANQVKNDSFKTGTLSYKSSVENVKFMATSGLQFYQGIGSCNKKGKGGIPPCEMVGIKNYTVTTKPIFMPGVKGVEGNFYQILPFEILVEQYGKKTKRGDLGIHGDFNVLGTSGCVGIPAGEHWRKFQELMLRASLRGETTINLVVPMRN